MERTQVQLEKAAYDELRRRAFEKGVSMSALLRELLRECLGAGPSPRRLEDFTFVGSGRSGQGDLAPVSERHDEALYEAYGR